MDLGDSNLPQYILQNSIYINTQKCIFPNDNSYASIIAYTSDREVI